MMKRYPFFRTPGALACTLAFLAACSPQTSATGPLPGAASSAASGGHVSAPVSFEPAQVLALTRPPENPLSNGSGWLKPPKAKCKSTLYASSYWLAYVGIYCFVGKRQNQPPRGEITAGIRGPEGAATDTKGNYYVANGGANTVTEYALNTTNVSFTYSTGLSSPGSVAVDKDNNVYVTNIGTGSVSVFPQGVNTPSKTLTGIPYPIDVAVDAKGNVYVTTYTSSFSNGIVLEFAAGSSQGVDLGIVTQEPGGIVLDTKDSIVTTDQRLPGVLVFPRGKTTPSKIFAQTMLNPVSLRMDHSGSNVFVGDSVDNAVNEYKYSNGSLIDTITDGIDGPEGLAVYPPAPLARRGW
jgi:hypothetical protein